MKRLWDKGAPLDERVLHYTAGEDHALDERLVAYDVRASIAHAEMLARQGLLAVPDLEAIRAGLLGLAESHARGEWRIELADEDGQTALERRLTERIGPAGGRIHLGRSRNDQVLAALRLYLLETLDALSTGVLAVAAALDELAARERRTVIPGYTHLQQAMPSSVPLWAGGFAAELRDDAAALTQARRRLDKNPLGSAAGYGTPGLPVDREATRTALGFAAVQEPVTAVQLSRGKGEAQLIFEIALLMQDLSRFAADVLLFSTREFGFLALAEEFTTGSSIMPQKRNLDVFELMRGRTATAQACLTEALGVAAKLPSGYHRDLQLIKFPLFRAIDLALETLAVAPPAIGALEFRPESVRLDPAVHAAEEANRLVVTEGIPFREAYQRVARKLKGKV
ncbi:MAG: argininosuccinate lyase [Gammaproteobacteria bacterium 13_2_20CM_66_19]|nr:MAG: argininosuccinate lyase [Gammaproteobacteria bacterium 13_2_20CM_66_19]TLY89852.1 MAG: argininosuccinate lyase [Gammaproteobacteria bacterium]TLZ09240.1 MAG: argininosuccinate lyase [Gammaproteobacteria bacterium]TLZ11529.1 MAG: argininosuccinate lyase [Gammaproteobacteria bacterium]TLZ18271.1 MAG: argininosuccinate lyase [Gammaproteobacteria bacterium]